MVWHLLKSGTEHEVWCGANDENIISTTDLSIVDCEECIELFKGV
jgi:hypothetical protein